MLSPVAVPYCILGTYTSLARTVKAESYKTASSNVCNSRDLTPTLQLDFLILKASVHNHHHSRTSVASSTRTGRIDECNMMQRLRRMRARSLDAYRITPNKFAEVAVHVVLKLYIIRPQSSACRVSHHAHGVVVHLYNKLSLNDEATRCLWSYTGRTFLLTVFVVVSSSTIVASAENGPEFGLRCWSSIVTHAVYVVAQFRK